MARRSVLAAPEGASTFTDVWLEEYAHLPGPDAGEVSHWEERLAEADCAAREAAERELRAQGERAIPVLRALRRSSDMEVRARAQVVLEDLARP